VGGWAEGFRPGHWSAAPGPDWINAGSP
jgi:hypothetical protein